MAEALLLAECNGRLTDRTGSLFERTLKDIVRCTIHLLCTIDSNFRGQFTIGVSVLSIAGSIVLQTSDWIEIIMKASVWRNYNF